MSLEPASLSTATVFEFGQRPVATPLLAAGPEIASEHVNLFDLLDAVTVPSSETVADIANGDLSQPQC